MFITIDSSNKALPYVAKFAENLRQKFHNEGFSVQVLSDPFGSDNIMQGLLTAISNVRQKTGVGPRAANLFLLAARSELLQYIHSGASEIIILLGGPKKWHQDEIDIIQAIGCPITLSEDGCDIIRASRIADPCLSPLLGFSMELARQFWPNLCIHLNSPSEDRDVDFSMICRPATTQRCTTDDLEDSMVRVFKWVLEEQRQPAST